VNTFPENRLLGVSIDLAHSTFYDALPANMENRRPIAAAGPLSGKRAPRGSAFQRLWNALDTWFYRQRQKDREAYFAQATDVFDLERRVRARQSAR